MKIDYEKVDSIEKAFETVKANITEEKLKKLQVDANITDNGNDCISASGKGFDFTLDFYDDHCAAKLKLSLFLKPFKGKIEGYLEKELRKVL